MGVELSVPENRPPPKIVPRKSSYRKGWQVQFVEADLNTPLARQFTFKDPEKIRELARRAEARGDSESPQMLEHAIEQTGGAGATCG